jgi:ArsR family transcriptional regulator, virulence genes transcriptional regulator
LLAVTVGALVYAVGLSQSALSQHLARLRSGGLVTFRREAQTLDYRIASPNTERVIAVLRDIYCPERGTEMSQHVAQ